MTTNPLLEKVKAKVAENTTQKTKSEVDAIIADLNKNIDIFLKDSKEKTFAVHAEFSGYNSDIPAITAALKAHFAGFAVSITSTRSSSYHATLMLEPEVRPRYGDNPSGNPFLNS